MRGKEGNHYIGMLGHSILNFGNRNLSIVSNGWNMAWGKLFRKQDTSSR